MYEHDDNPYAPPSTLEDDSKVDFLDEESFSIDFQAPERYTIWLYFLFNFASLFNAYTLVGLHFVAMSVFMVVAGRREAQNDIFLVGIFLAILMICGIWWLYVFPFLRLNRIYSWIVKPVRERLPVNVEPVTVAVKFFPRMIHNSREDLKHLKKKYGYRCENGASDVGFLFFEDEKLRFEGDSCRFTLSPDALAPTSFWLARNSRVSGSNSIFLTFKKGEHQPFGRIEISVHENRSFFSDLRKNKQLYNEIVIWIG